MSLPRAHCLSPMAIRCRKPSLSMVLRTSFALLPPPRVVLVQKSALLMSVNDWRKRKLQNAHQRFGSLEFIKRTKDTTTRIRVHVDRAILETSEKERGQASAHLVSMIDGDSEIGALWAAVIEGASFQIQLPGQPSVAASLGPEAQCFRGSVMVPGRKSSAALGGCVGRASQDEAWCRPSRRADHSVR